MRYTLIEILLNRKCYKTIAVKLLRIKDKFQLLFMIKLTDRSQSGCDYKKQRFAPYLLYTAKTSTLRTKSISLFIYKNNYTLINFYLLLLLKILFTLWFWLHNLA